MAISFVGRTSALPGTPVGTALTVTLPGGYAAADVLLVCIMANNLSLVTTPPAGWTLIVTQDYAGGSGEYRVFAKAATGGEGADEVWTVTPHGSGYRWTALAYRGAAPTTYVTAGNSSGGAAVTSWTSPTFSAVVESWAVAFIKSASGTSKDASSNLRSASLGSIDMVAFDRVTGPGTTSGSTLNSSSPEFSCAVTVGLRPVNSAPYAPTLNLPISGATIDVGATNRFFWTFNDPDVDLPRAEGQSKYEIQYRVIGAPTWTTLTPAPTTNQYHDFAAATFTSGWEVEWQVRTYDLAGEVGPWSSAEFFTGGTAPSAPSITDPTVNEEITANSFDVDWTVTNQTAYQIRTVVDDGGSPDATEVYYDSGTVADSAARTATVPFVTNNRFEHVQVRVWHGNLWSSWASVRVEVAYTPPPAPVVTLSVDTATASLLVEYDTPTPVGDQPTPTYVDIWIDDGGDIGDERKAAGLAIDGSWSFLSPRSGRDYEPHVRVIAYTADGIPSE